MTICNKIQKVGETMETNLNARGVSCTFGTGTGESTVLDMVEMVNGTNFRGSSDVNLKIGANRPYLLENETTDVVVKLENGLCEPLKNKNVIVGQSVFRDGGTTSNYSNWDSTNSSTSLTRLNDYSELKRKENASTFAWITKSLSVTDGITIEFDLQQATLPSSNKTYFTFRATGGSVKLGVYKAYENLADGQWHHYRFDVNGLTVTPTIDGVQRDDLSLSANFNYVQLDASEEAVHHFKNFVVYENINGVTDGKGEFALYDVSVTDDTTFTATYGTETATCKVILATKRDYGTSSNHNDIWGTNSSTSTFSFVRGVAYTEMKELTSSNFGNATSITAPCTIEVDFYQVDGYRTQAFFQILGSNNSALATRRLEHIGGIVGEWVHLKLEIGSNQLIFTNTGNNRSSTVTWSSGTPAKFNWWSSSDITAIRFKNFVIY